MTAGDYFTVWIYQGGAVPDVRVIEVRRSHAARAVRRAVRGAQPGGGPGSPAAEDRAPGRNPAGPLMAGPGPCRAPASLTAGPSQVAAGEGSPAWPEGRASASYEAARSVDRYLRVRAKHALAARPELWLGISGRGPVTPDGIYQIVANAGRRAGVAVYPHRFRHHFSHTYQFGPRRYRGRPDGAERLVVSADAGVVRRQCPGCPGPPQLRPDHEWLTGLHGARQLPGALADAGRFPPRFPAGQGHRCCAKLVIRMVRIT